MQGRNIDLITANVTRARGTTRFPKRRRAHVSKCVPMCIVCEGVEKCLGMLQHANSLYVNVLHWKCVRGYENYDGFITFECYLILYFSKVGLFFSTVELLWGFFSVSLQFIEEKNNIFFWLKNIICFKIDLGKQVLLLLLDSLMWVICFYYDTLKINWIFLYVFMCNFLRN